MGKARPQLSIPTRIFVGFALVLTAFGIVAITSLVQHQQNAATLRLLEEVDLPLTLTVVEANATQAVLDTLLGKDMSERDRSVLNTLRQVRPGKLRGAFHSIDRADDLDLGPDDRDAIARTRQTLEEVQVLYERGEPLYDALFDAIESDDPAADPDRALEEVRAHERTVQRKLVDARRALRDRIATVSARAAEQERQAAVLLGALTVLALLIGVAVIWWAHRMLSPLPRLQERVAAVARGDLSRKLHPKTDDELGRLAGEFERMVAALAARDARLREATEAQLRLQRLQERIVQDLRAAIVVVDREDIVRSANPAAATVLGVEAEATGGRLADSGLHERLPGLQDAVARVRAGEERALLTGVALASEDRSVNVLVTPFGAGGPTEADADAVLVVAEDVTEELRTKTRLIQTERLAAIGQMASHVTHEVRNPLSSIGLNVEMLEDEMAGAGPEAQALIRAVQREIDRLTGITEEYLRLARLPQPRLEPEDIGELVRSLAQFVRREMEEADVEMTIQIEDDLPPVAMDEPQIRQALLNLVRNARESQPDGGRVWLTVARDGTGVKLVVRDEGSGIPEVQRERMFDLFYTTKERGSGLGLPLTQQIVVAHEGQIRCDSAAGAGTTFELWFPAAAATSGGGSVDEPTDGEHAVEAANDTL